MYIQSHTDHTHNGTIIWSDSWAAYNNIQQLPTVQNHDTVNHSLEFVDSQTGVHTNHIESYWNRVKIKLKRMRGCRWGHIWMSFFGERDMAGHLVMYWKTCREI